MMMARWNTGWRRGLPLAALSLVLGGCPTPSATIPDTTQGVEEEEVPNSAPTAAAGPDQSVLAGDAVFLTGSDSSDPDEDRLVFIWRQVSGEPEVTLEDGGSSRPSFFAPDGIEETTVLTFRLTVADGFAVDFDEVSITVVP